MADDIPPDVNPPDLRQVWGDHGGGDYGPLMDGTVRLPPPDPQATQETSPPTGPPNVRPYRVSPFSIAGVVSRILKETETCVYSYNSMKDYVNSTKWWIFDVHDPDVLTKPVTEPTDSAGAVGGNHDPSNHDPGEAGHTTTHDPIDPHPGWTKDGTAISDNLLLQVADAIELAGQYAFALNNAGQIYVKADKDSALPDMPVQNTIDSMSNLAGGLQWQRSRAPLDPPATG